MILSVVLAVVFYSCVILAVGYVLNPSEIAELGAGTGLVTADAMAKAFGTALWQKYHRRRYVRYHHILELLYDRRFPCPVLYG